MMVLLAFLLFSNITFLLIMASTCAFDGAGLPFFNPVYLYNNIKVNWFGAWFIALVLNIWLAPHAVCYWLYKLCTVGRK